MQRTKQNEIDAHTMIVAFGGDREDQIKMRETVRGKWAKMRNATQVSVIAQVAREQYHFKSFGDLTNLILEIE